MFSSLTTSGPSPAARARRRRAAAGDGATWRAEPGCDVEVGGSAAQSAPPRAVRARRWTSRGRALRRDLVLQEGRAGLRQADMQHQHRQAAPRRSGSRRRDGRACRRRAGSSSIARTSRPRRAGAPPRRPGSSSSAKAPAGAGASVRVRWEVMQTSAKSTERSTPSRSGSATWTTGAASRLAPIRFSRRSTSSAPVTTRRARRIASRFAASPGSSHSPASPGNRAGAPSSPPGEALEPDLLHGERQHRREPGDEPVEERVEHRPGRPPARAGRRVAVERVLADVEVERRQVDGAELEELLEHALEVVGGVAGAHRRVELGEAVQHPALELRHLRRRDALGLGEAVEGAEQEAQRVAQPPVAVGGPFRISGPMRWSTL